MATINQIELPDDLLKLIQRRAAAQQISVQELVVRDLVQANWEQQDEESLLAEIRENRERLAANGVFVTDDILNEAKSWGRK